MAKKVNYLHPKFIFFLYTLLRFGYNWILKIPLWNFHKYSTDGIIKILKEYIDYWFTNEVTIINRTNDENWTFIKDSNFYIKDFNNNPSSESEVKNFIILIESNTVKIKTFLKDYFDYWYNDNLDRNYFSYISPKKQLELLVPIIKSSNNNRYIVKNLHEIDEISIIIYMYISNLITIDKDCINILEDKGEVFFIPEINIDLYEKQFNNNYVRISSDYSKIINNNKEVLYLFTNIERKIIGELMKFSPDSITLDNLRTITWQPTNAWCKQSIKMLRSRFKDLKIDNKIDILSIRWSWEYRIKLVE
jgi:hypothetical protein